METVSRPHARNLVRWAAGRPEVIVLSADLTASCEADDFREAYPDRFFSLGMAEQAMLSIAGGLAREGLTPFVHTFSVFICRRGFDQLAMSIAYPCLRVRLLGFLPGVTTPGGATHQANDDIALMRALPNMTVLECGDATEVESVLEVAQSVHGPVYVRMLRGEVPRLFDPSAPIALGEARLLSEGTDVSVVTSGVSTAEALRVTPLLRARGVSVRHVHVSSHKPFAAEPILAAAAATPRGVVTLENHGTIGGLGSAVAEVLAEAGASRPLVRLGLRDTYAHGASRDYLMREQQIDAMALVRAVERLCETSLGIGEADLPRAPSVLSFHSAAKAEGL